MPVVALRLMRPHQWTKNAFCLAGLIFSGRFTDPPSILEAVFYFALFCAASSSMYIANDIFDWKRDLEHPKKRFRPLPAGHISIPRARLLALGLGALALVGGFWVHPLSLTCLTGFILLQLAYSLRLKHEALLDVGAIALGFVLRLLGGVFVVNEQPTTWITLCTFFLALFLGFSKRRAELGELAVQSDNPQRPVLSKYSLGSLDSLVNSMATLAVMCYALFTVTSGKNPSLIITVPIVVYAILYYKMLVLTRIGAQEPDRILLFDRRIQFTIVLWLIVYLCVLHFDIQIFR
jgi:4-hydroxybenzoate polyprenyltransferase